MAIAYAIAQQIARSPLPPKLGKDGGQKMPIAKPEQPASRVKPMAVAIQAKIAIGHCDAGNHQLAVVSKVDIM
ncbi:hypothetical protein [Cylindrospermum stagnale]|uniref:hypothetical protein n=1 Tax=Cylindrospermum stagnale TaxID=142864 RepID=UPI0002D9A05A|nr:hypothetical protein [Cylindrospermum stagnale]